VARTPLHSGYFAAGLGLAYFFSLAEDDVYAVAVPWHSAIQNNPRRRLGDIPKPPVPTQLLPRQVVRRSRMATACVFADWAGFIGRAIPTATRIPCRRRADGPGGLQALVREK